MTRSLDVLHVIESLGHGGAEQSLLSLIRRLPQHRHHLAWLYADDRLRDAFAPHAASMIDLGVRRSLDLAAATAKLARWMRAHRPDVAHLQLVRAQLVGRVAATVAGGCPVVTTWQNAFYERAAVEDFGGSRGKQQAIRLLDRWSGRRDRRFIAVSQFIADRLSAQLGVAPDRVTVIYNAVEPQRFAPAPPELLERTRAELGLGREARVLLAVGRVVAQKGHVDAVRAMPEILRAAPHARLLIAGAAGSAEAALRATIDELGLGERVRLLGARRDVPTLYQLADAFVFPSRYEGLSVALVEALGSGLPAAISDIPQNREVAAGADDVVFVAPGSPSQLAAATLTVLGTERRRADRSALRERFAPDRLAARLSDTLAEAATACSRRARTP